MVRVEGGGEGVRLLLMWRVGGGVTMGGAGSEVGEEAGTQGVAGVQGLHGAQVAGNLRHTLPEAERQEVQGQGVGVDVTCRHVRSLFIETD